MDYGVTSKALYNQLLYFRGLWDLDKGVKKGGMSGGVGGEVGERNKESEEKVQAVREWNRERFQTCYGVVEGYLKRCGRVWVQMDELFGFALGM